MLRFGIRPIAQTFALVFVIMISAAAAHAQSTGGKILGRVSDPSGAVVTNATITVTNQATGVQNTTQANKTGDFVFPELAVGTYTVEYEAQGFKKDVHRDVTLALNQALTLNATLQLGSTAETVDVTSEAPLVDTTSTQLGAVVDSRAVVGLPLNTRDTYQLLQLQPGVMSNSGGSDSIVYGSDKPGVVSVNGGRGRANNFNVNGGDANDLFANLPTVQPNPDSIEEFKVITNTFDAEYGRNSGAVINVVTKSGTNNWHGSAYEFFRNKVLNAQGYFDTSKPDFQQNQFGGTVGGPIRKDQTFFFMSYEGRRIAQGTATPVISVPTTAQRNGDFSNLSPFQGTLTDQHVADVMNGRAGCDTAIGQVGGVLPSGGTPYASIFPTNVIPVPCMDPTAVALMNLYVPQPNIAGGQYQAVPVQTVRGDEGSIKFDHRINNNQNLSIYYYIDDSLTNQALSFFQQAGANVPGFGSVVPTRIQQVNISHTWTISNSLVNEARFTYMREGQIGFQAPITTNLVQNSCGSLVPANQCFRDPNNPKLGITPGLGAKYEGVPFISVPGAFSIGNNSEGQLPQAGNSFQVSDNLSKIVGNHSLKFGVDLRFMQFNQTLYYNVNGLYGYSSSDPNTPGLSGSYLPDYLLGLPNSFSQGSAQAEHVRTNSVYLYAQDSWKIKPSLTMNYGLRWELDTPLHDISKHVQTYRPGQATTIYPCQLSDASVASLGATSNDCSQNSPNNAYFPLGLVFPGDHNVPGGLTQTYYNAWAPRIGIAWAPSGSSGWMHKLTGSAGSTSIRAGFGVFYNPIEQLVLEQFGAEPPFGGSTFVSNPMFNTPFVPQAFNPAAGVNYTPNPFNGILSPPQGTPIDWSTFRPILLFGDFQPHMRTQYAEQYNLTIQREIGQSVVVQVGYVGSQGHRLLVSHDINYGNPQTCLGLINIANANPNAVYTSNPANGGTSTTCGQFGADSSYYVAPGQIPSGMSLTLPNGQVVQGGPNSPALTMIGIRRYSSPNCNYFTGAGCPSDGVPIFSNIFAEDTIGNSNYNSFQASVEKRYSKGLQFQLAYTWSKSFDYGSSFEGELNPINPALSYSLSLFDARHRFVASYTWELPVQQYQGAKGKLLDGWVVSGITTFQTGFPIRIFSAADNELLTSSFFEPVGSPLQLAPFQTLHPQSNSNFYFNPNNFSENAAQYPQLLGSFGNTPRTVCCGPGIDNWDFTIQKNTKIGERWNTQFRAEFFNLFNHTQFYNPVGNSSDPQFGLITQARPPRLIQFAFKVMF
jgi:hypothetical protein